MGGSTSTTSSMQAFNTGPWLGQQDYLTSAFSDAQDLYNQQMGQAGYSGDFVAQATPEQYSMFNGLQNMTATDGTNAVQNAWGAGSNLLNQGQNTLSQGINGLSSIASQNPYATANQNINVANQYANSPYLQNAVNGAMASERQQLSEGTLPAIDRAAIGSGNENSTRAGVAAGIAQRGVDTDAANMYSTMQNQLYNQGLSMANTATQNQLSAYNTLGSLGAGQVNAGLSGLSTGTNMNASNTNTAATDTGMLMNMDQAGLTNAMDQDQYNRNRDWSLLNNYYNIVGNKSWGSSGISYGNSTTQTQQSPLSSIGGAIGAIGGLL